MPSRWERLLDSKPIPVLDHLIEEVAKLFAESLKRWPPEIDDATAPTLALLHERPLRPEDAMFREAFRLARWDLDREFDAFDDYIRNQRWLAAGLTPTDKPLLLFLSRFLTEQALGLNEATQGRIDRKRMLTVLGRTERLLLRGLLS
jgi:hypothetical protein